MSPEDALAALAAEAIAEADGRRPAVLGLCGPQGSGKSTLAAALVRRFDRAAILSLDDLYLTRAERLRLARDVHPLLATRGPPATHDVALGVATLAALDRGEPVLLPRFDKATDDRAPRSAWPAAPAGCRLLVLEGWCVGAVPQPEAALNDPVNALERDEDAAGTWRRHVNAALTGYRPFWTRIDRLALLCPSDFAVVFGWRREQEHGLRLANPGAAGVMDDAALDRFVQHYERLTRHVLNEMPARADLLIALDRFRRMETVMHNHPLVN